ncbi:ADP-ribosylglycohydrolase family protein [Streptomyces hainanensis]|uniref:ADP-ribosylglycohydrolase family protein n=1 Tax=Streptomyces hainanensis TaxID=402648 RepID=A0A4V2Y3X3_9ACTN|nr:ADP-ribosylglycohydrolase family protein [Streptomyces hainanensis]
MSTEFTSPTSIPVRSFDHRSAARDALRGVAVGDAFGAQFFVPENLPRLRERRLPDAGWPWTDDTEMACSVFDVLRRHGGVDQHDLVRGFARRHDFDRGYGPAMNRLLRLVRGGGKWQELAAGLFDGQGSWGNGAAMRVAPLGAWFAVDVAEAAAQAGRSARVTHTHPEAVAGAVAVAVAAALAARGRVEPVTGERLLAAVEELTPAGRVRSGLAEARELLGQPHAEYAAHRLGNGRRVSAADTVPFALWCAARHLDDFTEALWACASAGGDVDTTCAIVGGIVAARVGTAGIPAAWQVAREPLPEWVAEHELGEDLSRAGLGAEAAPPRRPEPIPVPDLVWTPGQWQRVRHGVRSQSMDDRWDAYLEGDHLFLHRSWTGYGVFQVTVAEDPAGWRPVAALVESDPERYRRLGDEAESAFLELFLRAWYMDDTRPELWERYQELRRADR